MTWRGCQGKNAGCYTEMGWPFNKCYIISRRRKGELVMIFIWLLGIRLKGATVYRDGFKRWRDDSRKKPGDHQRNDRSVRKCSNAILSGSISMKNNGLHRRPKDGKTLRDLYRYGRRGNIPIPRSIVKGDHKNKEWRGKNPYDFQYTTSRTKKNHRGIVTYIPPIRNYAKLISGVLGMKCQFRCCHLVQSLNLDSESINNWKNGVKEPEEYIPNGTKERGNAMRFRELLWGRLPDLQGLQPF